MDENLLDHIQTSMSPITLIRDAFASILYLTPFIMLLSCGFKYLLSAEILREPRVIYSNNVELLRDQDLWDLAAEVKTVKAIRRRTSGL